jgi:hypothetical protein
MSRFANYDIAACELIFGGVAIKDGLVSAAFVMAGDAFADEIGADGHVVRYATHENRCTVSVVLKGSSEENAKLSAIHAADVLASNGLGVVPLFFKDGNGTTTYATSAAWVMKLPDNTKAAAPADVTWTIRAVLNAPLNAIVGGN